MKRMLVATILGIGLLAVAGATLIDRFGMVVADGQPPPPPKPPLPPAQAGYQRTPWLTADGQPPPPPPHPPVSSVQV